MPLSDVLRELELLVKSRYGLIVLETLEAERAEGLMRLLASRLLMPLFFWSPSQGLRVEGGKEEIYASSTVKGALEHMQVSQTPALYQMRGLEGFLDDPVVLDKLLDVARRYASMDGAVFVTGADVVLPHVLHPHSISVKVPAPSPKELRDLMGQLLRDVGKKTPIGFELLPEEMERLLRNLRGLTLVEAQKILTKAMLEDGKLAPGDLGRIVQAKKKIIEREGLLEYYPLEANHPTLAGLSGLKRWLSRRKKLLLEPQKAREFGLGFPRGVLLLGVPGTGKSLAAKTIAHEWGLPLLKMDTGSLYNKYIGESEKNFKRAMHLAEKMSPVVLWIDEIEKAFASGGDYDGGVSQRVLGSFLSWMQEHQGEVFVVATANDVQKLPAEMLRKGRFDELFFVDLPDGPTRKEILRVHLSKRYQNPAAFDLDALVAITEGFSGAELEQVIVSALYTAFAEERDLTNQMLLEEIAFTKPLSQTRAEHIEALREWARERTVSAG